MRKHQEQIEALERQDRDLLQGERQAFAREKIELKMIHDRAFDRVSADLAFREGEIETILFAEKELSDSESRDNLFGALERVVRALFQNDVAGFVAWGIDDAARAWAKTGIASEDARWVEVARKNFRHPDIFEHGSAAICSGEELGDRSAVPEKADTSAYTLVYFPLMAHGRRLGVACGFFQGSSHQTRLRMLKHALDRFCDILYRISRVDEEYRAGRIDPLTGLPNARAVYDLLPPAVARASEAEPVGLVFIEGNSLAEINEKYGHAVADEMIQELLKVIQSSARVEELNAVRPLDQCIRYGDAQYLIIAEDSDAQQCSAVAERIREAVESKVDWPRGVPMWSVSIGVAVYPGDAEGFKDLLQKAEIALLYLKEKGERNSVIRFDQVPRNFRTAKLSGTVSGSLNVFDPATTLQSVARAQHTGILTVTNAQGRLFWSFFEKGKITKAYLDNFRADTAVVEFLSTFEDGSFDFREYSQLDAEALEEIHSMDESYDMQKSLDRNLMDGALAQDQLAAAHRLMPNARLFVKPSLQFREIICALPKGKEPPTRQEFEAMQAICKYINGRTMMSAIIDKLSSSYPTYLRWHAAALLVRSQAVELTKLALSFTLN